MKNAKEKILNALEGRGKIEKELREIINNMKKGGIINYWQIADMFDEWDKNTDTLNYEIVTEYENVLDDLEANGIIKFKKDEDGNDNIIIKIK